jgi:hypothetical protein
LNKGLNKILIYSQEYLLLSINRYGMDCRLENARLSNATDAALEDMLNARMADLL